jgi:hypothetical protein
MRIKILAAPAVHWISTKHHIGPASDSHEMAQVSKAFADRDKERDTADLHVLTKERRPKLNEIIIQVTSFTDSPLVEPLHEERQIQRIRNTKIHEKHGS